MRVGRFFWGGAGVTWCGNIFVRFHGTFGENDLVSSPPLPPPARVCNAIASAISGSRPRLQLELTAVVELFAVSCAPLFGK